MSKLGKAVSGVAKAISAKYRADSWINTMTGLGGRKDKTSYMSFGSLYCLTPEEAECLYHGDDLAARIVDAVVHHALMQGFDVADDEDGRIGDLIRKWDLKHHIMEAAIWGRCLGGSAIMMGVDRGRMDEPLDLDQVRPGDLKYLMVLDRRDLWVETRFNDPAQANFGEPSQYRLSRSSDLGINTQQGVLVHASRLVMFGGALTSDRMKRRNGGWDYSVLQRPYDVLRDVNSNWRAVTHLMQDLSQAVFKIKGLVDIIAEGQKNAIQDRMEIVNMARSVARAVIVDAETEDFSQVGAANVAGLEGILEKTWQRLAAAARMPVAILMGMSPSGMNATGDADMRSWFNEVRTYQETELAPKLQRLVQVITASEGVNLAQEPQIEWPSLWQMSPSEEATHRQMVAQTDAIYLNSGVLRAEEVAQARWGRGSYSDETAQAIDFEARAREEALRPVPQVPEEE